MSVVAADGQALTDAETRQLRDVASTLAAPLEIVALKQMTRTLMTTDLGQRTADRVLNGAIRRGGCESVPAVLYRRPRSPRLHRDRPDRQPRESARGIVQAAELPRADVARLQ